MALNSNRHIVLLVGGVGGAKLAYGLTQLISPDRLTIIVNVADDFWHYGLRICPDLDTITYTLSGVVDKKNGWGIDSDTRHMLDALGRLGGETWFGLGDQDLATHLVRTDMLRKGATLTEVTHYLSQRLGVLHQILPVTDAPIATKVDTQEYGELDFQTYFVRYRWQPTVRSLRYVGIENAHISAAVATALDTADWIVFGPSNPWLSVEPILAVPGFRERLLQHTGPRIAVTPIIGGGAVKGPAAKLMGEMGYAVTPETVAAFYGETINGFVIDPRDPGHHLPENIRELKINTLMRTNDDKINLAREIIAWLEKWD